MSLATNCTLLGANSSVAAVSLTNATAIGYNAVAPASNVCLLGNAQRVQESAAGRIFVTTPYNFAATGTVSAANLLGGLITCTGLAASQALTFDTAANIIATVFLGQTTAGLSHKVVLYNNSANTFTLVAGAGNTLVQMRTPIQSGLSAEWTFRVTGAGAVTIYC
jgi:hypothetical protein